MRIMIVDDNAVMRKVLAALFASVGHEVVCLLEDGNEIEARLAEIQPELVCLDYNLPGRDGLDLLAVVQAIAPQVDVVFMTASNEDGIEGRAADAGASGFIRKPFGQAQIIKELEGIIAARQLTKASVAAPSNQAPGQVQRATAVVADDNGSVRLVLKALLEESGLRVVQTVTNGAEAVQAALVHKPWVLCLDVNMPVMSGLEALPKVLEASPQTKVVMVTGCADKKLVAQAAGLGAVGYIIKPLRPAYVENFMRRLRG